MIVEGGAIYDDVLSRGLFEEISVLFRDLSLLFEMKFSFLK